MSIKIECPSCKQQYSVEESLLGEEVECAVCNTTFVAKKKPPIKLELPDKKQEKTPFLLHLPSTDESNSQNSDPSKCIAPAKKIPSGNGLDANLTDKKQDINTFNVSNITNQSAVTNDSIVSDEDAKEKAIKPELAGPWRRWAARFIDLTFESFVCSLILYTFFYLFYDSNSTNTSYSYSSDPIEAIASWLINYILAPASSFFLDSAIYGIFKGTFGKWLFGVKVIEMAGEKPIASRYFTRNLGVLYGGFGLSIPFVNWIAAITQYCRVSKGKPTSYDEHLGFKTIKHNDTILKTAIGIAFVVLIFFIALLLRGYRKTIYIMC